MKIPRGWFALGVGLACGNAAISAGEPLATPARQALDRSAGYLQSIATEGGYLWRYAHDLSQRAGEELATPTQVWVQPPGTPTIGHAWLRAHAVTREPRYLEQARAAALALVRGQLQSGGWDYLIEFDPAQRRKWAYRADGATALPAAGDSRRNISTYDDNNTQSALGFLLEFLGAAKAAPDPRDASIQEALDYGLAKLLEAQYPNGGWPQRWDGRPRREEDYPVKPATIPADYPREQPATSYFHYYTLNDNTQRDAILVLLEAAKRTGRADCRAAAQRGADFLVLAQLPEPQPGWAQQYNPAMEPAWARAFEPPSLTASEGAQAMRLLTDLYLEFGDERYVRRLPEAIAWFRRSAIAPGRWARMYELGTNRPIYGDRDRKIHYTVEELSEERRTGYGWQGDFGVADAIEYTEAVLKEGREKWRADHAPKEPTAKRRAALAARLEPRVRTVIAALDAQGRWTTPQGGRFVDPRNGPWVQTMLFAQNFQLLCDYLEAVAGK